jgi:hypothetical protein
MSVLNLNCPNTGASGRVAELPDGITTDVLPDSNTRFFAQFPRLDCD